MLEKYNKKRNFDKTKEPVGEVIKNGEKLVFVIHKHDARRLHYDLRLEMQGVLKSWAVPKGPSTDPSEKRLSVMVEDHPFSYKDFEGIIPKGEYGGGTVIIWDYGTYVPIYSTNNKKKDEQSLLKMLESGHISFILDGKKLKGEYALIRLKKAKEDNWILLKKNDQHAFEKIKNDDVSAFSGMTMKEVEQGMNMRDPKMILNDLEIENVEKGRMPHHIKVMLASLSDKPFDRDSWIFEIKWDGYRTIAEVESGNVKLYSRNFKSFNEKFSEIADTLKMLHFDVVLDGEVIVFDDEGKPSFELLQNYEKERKGIIVYYVFDILYLNGYLLENVPLVKRKEILQIILDDFANVKYTDHFENQGIELFDLVVKNGMEGVIGKDSESEYIQGSRSKQWLKIKNVYKQEAIICGYTRPRRSRIGFGALILGVYEGKDLIYIGHTGGGFDDKSLQDILKRFQKYITKKCPFKKIPKTNEIPTWMDPKLVCEVKFSEWTKEGVMRQPIFLGFREDKDPLEVVREKSEKQDLSDTQTRKYKSMSTERKVTFTNLSKVYFPQLDIKKGDIIEYYRSVSSYILPYLIDRPESLNRFPNGIDEPGFYQKNFGSKDLPSWIETFKVYSESEDKNVNYMLIKDLESLLYIINLGCIDVNPWSSKISSIDNPDYIIIDLDPEDIGFKEVITVAKTVHEVLESIGVRSFCKTSGATGIHILIPTKAMYTYDQVLEFSKLINIIINMKLPKITSIERKPSNRKKRVYLDYLQNRRGQTIASVYSLRPVRSASVSTPLDWSELDDKGLKPENFTINNIFKRLDIVGDVWEGFFDSSFDMGDALEKISQIYEKDFKKAKFIH